MWKQAPSSAAAACSFSRRRGSSDSDGTVSHCDNSLTSVFGSCISGLDQIAISSPFESQAIDQLKSIVVDAPNTQLCSGSCSTILNHVHEKIQGDSGYSSAKPQLLALVDGSRLRSSHREPRNRTRWKLYSSERTDDQIIISPASLIQTEVNSRCSTAQESPQITDDMQSTDPSSLFDPGTSLGRVATAPNTSRIVKAHSKTNWSQPKKRKLRISSGSDQESALLPVSLSAASSSTDHDSLSESSGVSSLTSEQQLHMADQEGSRSSSVEDVAGHLHKDLRGSSPGPRDQVQERQELARSSPQSSTPDPLERVGLPMRLVPPVIDTVESSHEQELVLNSSSAGPEREFYPETAVPSVAIERKREISDQESRLYRQGLRPSRPDQLQLQLDVDNPSSPRDFAHELSGSTWPRVEGTSLHEEVGPSWLQLGLGTTVQPKASGSGEATVQESEIPTSRFSCPEVSISPVTAVLPSLYPTERRVERLPLEAPWNAPTSVGLNHPYSRVDGQLRPFSLSFQPLQEPVRPSARRPESGTGDMPELDPASGFSSLQHLLPPSSDQHQAYHILSSQGPASWTVRQQVHGVSTSGRFPFPERGDARQPSAEEAGHISSLIAEGLLQHRLQFFQPATSSSVAVPSLHPNQSEEPLLLSTERMMQSVGAVPSINSLDPFRRPRSSDQRRSTPLEQYSTVRLPWRHQISTGTSSTRRVLDWRGTMSNSTAANLGSAQRGEILQHPMGREQFERIGPTNVTQHEFRVPLQSAAGPVSQDIMNMPTLRRAAPPFHILTPGSTTSQLLQWNTRLGVGVGGASWSSSSIQPPQYDSEQPRSRWDSATAVAGGSFLSLTAAPGPSSSSRSRAAEADLTSARIPETSWHSSGHLWFQLLATVNQNGIPALDQVPKRYFRVKLDDNVTVSVVRRYLVKRLELGHESEVEISCNGLILQPMLSLRYVRENIWQPRQLQGMHNFPSSSSAVRLDGTSSHRMIQLSDRSTLSSEDVVMILNYTRAHQA